jgi:hypothetical protein
MANRFAADAAQTSQNRGRGCPWGAEIRSGEAARAAEDGAEAWLPDGRIVFAHFRGDEPLPHWYLIRVDGSHLRSLPQLRGAGDPIDWLG